MAGTPVVWFEIAGRDLETLKSFYGRVFEWKIDAGNPLQYGMVETGGEGGIPGGVFAPGSDLEYVSFYIDVPDLEARLVLAERHGAKVVQPVTPLTSGGRIAMITDPEGHRVGLIQH